MAEPSLTPEAARDGVLKLLRETLQQLPEGYVLDGSRYGGGGNVSPCTDDPIPDPPSAYNDWRDLRAPAGTNYDALIGQVGDIWRKWGWRVVEREGFDKPNQFGYAPDGYWLSIQSAGSYYPSVVGASPCFPGVGDEARYRFLDVPATISKE